MTYGAGRVLARPAINYGIRAVSGGRIISLGNLVFNAVHGEYDPNEIPAMPYPPGIYTPPRPGVIPGTIESLGPIAIAPPGEKCEFNTPGPGKCDEVFKTTRRDCLAAKGNPKLCNAKAAGAALLCALGNIGKGDGDGGGGGPTLGPGYTVR